MDNFTKRFISLSLLAVMAFFIWTGLQALFVDSNSTYSQSDGQNNRVASAKEWPEFTRSSIRETKANKRSSRSRSTRVPSFSDPVSATSRQPRAFGSATSTPFLSANEANGSDYSGLPNGRNVEVNQTTPRSLGLPNSGDNLAPIRQRARSGADTNQAKSARSEERDEDRDENDPDTDTDGEEEGKSDETGTSLSGRLVAENGQTVAGLQVDLTLINASPEERAKIKKTKLSTNTTKEGRFSFANVVIGDYKLCVPDNGYFAAICRNFHAPTTTADLTLRSIAGASVSGQVTSDSGEPLENVRISVLPDQKKSASTDKDGRYSLELNINENSTYQFYYTLKGYERGQQSKPGKELLAEGSTTFDFTMKALSGMSVEGTVRDDTGGVVQGQIVKLHSSKVRSSSVLSGRSDANGRFSISNVKPSDDYRISVSVRGSYKYIKRRKTPLVVEAGMAELEIELDAIASTSITMQIVNCEGFPAADETLRLFSGSQRIGEKTTDAQGSISFDTVPTGSLILKNAARPRIIVSGLKVGEDGSFPYQQIKIGRGLETVRVVVTDKSSSGLIEGAKVSLSKRIDENKVISQYSHSGSVTLRADGSASFSNICKGEQQLSVSKKGYKPYSQTITVQASGVDIPVELEPDGSQ